MVKNKDIRGIFIDFIVIVLLVSLLITSFVLGKALLYPYDVERRELYIRSMPVAYEYRDTLSEGDTLYDTLTKRNIGIIANIDILIFDEDIIFDIYLKDATAPRGSSLRSKTLWIPISDVVIKADGEA